MALLQRNDLHPRHHHGQYRLQKRSAFETSLPPDILMPFIRSRYNSRSQNLRIKNHDQPFHQLNH